MASRATSIARRPRPSPACSASGSRRPASPWSTTARSSDRRGSLTIDDEGTPSACNVLIEDGILVGYMQDRQNARLMGQRPTGNGRRQSFAHQPMPRMTNTYMRAGTRDPEEILAGVQSGLYAKTFGGGQVDITRASSCSPHPRPI